MTENVENSSELSNTELSKRAVVIYHDNCNDGFGAAWAFHKLMEEKYSEGVEYIPWQYGKGLPVLQFPSAETDLYILDFSFDKFNLSHLCGTHRKVVVLDHHKTAKEDLTGEWVNKPGNLEIVFDMERSGAGISWDYFSTRSHRRPVLINRIEDRDLWKFQYTHTREIHERLSLLPKDFDRWTRFAIRIENIHGFEDAVREGELLKEKDNAICLSIIDQCARACTINGVEGIICNAPGMFASEIGMLLAERSGTFGASYYQSSDGATKFSLRSIGEFDVSALAKEFGGGGHKNAAGFVLSNDVPGSFPGVSIWSGS